MFLVSLLAAPTAELVRVRRGVDGLALGAGPGRGAWLCRDHPVECLDRAERRRTLAVALRAPVTSDDVAGVRATLESEFAGDPVA